FIPIRTDRPLQATPYVNYALIAINVLVFFATFQQIRDAREWQQQFVGRTVINVDPVELDKFIVEEHPVTGLFLRPLDPKVYQFFTCLFLHADGWHLFFNMLFLWVFGNNVEDRFGKVGYLLFYFTAGVMGDIGHLLFSHAPVLGASGAVAGVTGAFLALFPRTRVTLLYFFIIIGAFQIPAMLVVMFYFLKDLLFWATPGLGGNTAYTAHLGGNLFGFGIGMALLLTRILPREHYDLMSLWAHKRRRDQFRKLSQSGYQAWEGTGLAGQDGKPLTEQDQAVIQLREQIARAVTDHDLTEATRQYRALIDTHGEQVLSQRNQFDIANQLYAEQDYPRAAGAYEQLLSTYPRHPDRGQAQLMLGLIFARYLARPDDAKPLLQEASQRLHGDEAKFARVVLAEIEGG
ncbi:MAG: rhomboid family intramembrane serine protease, partial [Planctomycetota bacterium]